jgi:VanZ family protein
MQRIFKIAAWLLALAITILSLAPPSYRPATGASQAFEHLSIFIAMGAAFGLGYPNKSRFLTIALVTFAGAIEIAQFWTPGRHARMSDFLLDTAASCLGIGVSWTLLKLRNIASVSK